MTRREESLCRKAFERHYPHQYYSENEIARYWNVWKSAWEACRNTVPAERGKNRERN